MDLPAFSKTAGVLRENVGVMCHSLSRFDVQNVMSQSKAALGQLCFVTAQISASMHTLIMKIMSERCLQTQIVY